MYINVKLKQFTRFDFVVFFISHERMGHFCVTIWTKHKQEQTVIYECCCLRHPDAAHSKWKLSNFDHLQHHFLKW